MYPEIEPYDAGFLDAGDRNLVYWETSGNPAGRPAVVVHGGPGSGSSPFFRRFFDPARYRIVQFDQRNCGRSLPHAGRPDVDLGPNHTGALIGDMERLREWLDIDRWLVVGGSWGSTLSLAYAERHPDRVTGIVLFGVTTGRHSEVDWAFRGGLGSMFPEQWRRLARYAGGLDVPGAIARLVADPKEDVRLEAARERCLWESAPASELQPRFRDPDFALAFARIVTHYVTHDLFLEDGILLRNASALSGVDGVLVNARSDHKGTRRERPRARRGVAEVQARRRRRGRPRHRAARRRGDRARHRRVRASAISAAVGIEGVANHPTELQPPFIARVRIPDPVKDGEHAG